MSVDREEARTGRGGKINLISNYAKNCTTDLAISKRRGRDGGPTHRPARALVVDCKEKVRLRLTAQAAHPEMLSGLAGTAHA